MRLTLYLLLLPLLSYAQTTTLTGTVIDEVNQTATDVLRNLPAISVAADGNIAVRSTNGLGLDYLSERVTAQGRDSRFFNPYLSLKKEFPKQRLSLLFQWQNIDLGLWEANEQAITTQTADFFTTTNYVYEVDILRVAVGYRFTRGKRDSRLPESEFGGREF